MTNEEIVKAIRGGKRELMGDLYLQNRRFIFALVKHVGIKPEFYEDAMQNSYIGLHKAVNGYDENAGFKFLTYAKYHIQQAIQRGQTNDIHIPEYILNYAKKIEHIQSELTASLGRLPTQAELSHKTKFDTKTINYIMSITKPVKSIYEPLGDSEENLTIADCIEDKSITFEDDIASADERRTVIKVLEALPEAERKAIWLYYFNKLSCKQIAQIMKITAMNVRCLIAKGLRLLRKPELSHQLIDSVNVYQTDFYTHKTLTNFKRTWTSISEQIVLQNEFLENKIKAAGNKD